MDRNGRLFLLILLCYGVGNVVSIPLTNIYLWQKTHEFFWVLLYNAMVFVSMAGAAVLGGYIGKKRSVKLVYALSMILYALHTLLLPHLTNTTATILVLGTISGVAIGLQSFAYTVIMQGMTSISNREAFLGRKTTLFNLVQFIVPPLIGLYLSVSTSYEPIFWAASFLFLVAAVASKFLVINEVKGQLDLGGVKTSFRENTDLRSVFQAKFLYGIQDGVFWVALGLITVELFGSILRWGVFSSVLTLISVLLSYLYGKYITLRDTSYTTIFVSFLFAAATIVLATNWNIWSFVVYQLTVVLLGVVMSVDFDSILGGILDRDKRIDTLRNEYDALSEVVVNIGRLVPISILILFQVNSLSGTVLRLAFLGIASIPLFTMTVLANTAFMRTFRKN